MTPPAGLESVGQTRQQAIGELAELALRGDGSGALLAAAARLVAQGLASPFAGIYELLDEHVLLRAGSHGEPDLGRHHGEGPLDLTDPGLRAALRAPGPIVALLPGHAAPGGAVLVAPVPEPEEQRLVLVAVATHGDDLDDDARAYVATIASLLGAALRRDRAEAALGYREAQLAAAERVAHLGSFQWDLAEDRVVWSDELYRIFGAEPRSFPVALRDFLDRVHADDRERIEADVDRARRQGRSFTCDVRIVRPDGQIRLLRSWGEVVADAAGNSMVVGVCQDVTDRREAELALQRSEHRFRALFHSAPDAVLVVEANGRILEANEQAERLFGYPVSELAGHPVEDVLVHGFTEAHASFRHALEVGAAAAKLPNREMTAQRADGAHLPVECSLGIMLSDEGPALTVFVRDLTQRRQADEYLEKLRQADAARRQALELNDNVVQGLSAAIYALQSGDQAAVTQALQRTLHAVRTMMTQLLTVTGPPQFAPGDLQRARPAPDLDLSRFAGSSRGSGQPDAIRIVVADDSPDLRLLLRTLLRSKPGMEVVGEAADGAAAVRLTEQLRPDVLILDLAMPVMDGLEALQRIRTAAPETKVLILSGFDEDHVSAQALELGAHDFVPKGLLARELVDAIARLCPDRPLASAPTPLENEGVPGTPRTAEVPDPSVLLHELRTPLAVIEGLVAALRESMDVLPSAAVQEVLTTVGRSAAQMSALLDAFSDARKIHSGELALTREPTDLALFVRQLVRDLSAVTGDHPVEVAIRAEPSLPVDRMQIRAALTNLLTNAATFSPPGSTIRVELRTTDDWAEIGVSDQGTGMSEQQREQVFRKRARIGGPGEGAGLGLFIAHGIAEAHGGQLFLGGSGTAGSTFVLRLPLHDHGEIDPRPAWPESGDSESPESAPDGDAF